MNESLASDGNECGGFDCAWRTNVYRLLLMVPQNGQLEEGTKKAEVRRIFRQKRHSKDDALLSH